MGGGNLNARMFFASRNFGTYHRHMYNNVMYRGVAGGDILVRQNSGGGGWGGGGGGNILNQIIFK